MKRLSVTLLDSFRLYRESDWFTLEMMLERITGEYEPSREMDIGSAFHACVENHTNEWGVNGVNYRFQPHDMVEFQKQMPVGMLPELKTVVNYVHAQVSGIVDGIYGKWICDHKTSFKPFHLDKYTDSYQWRFYLDMFGCDVFQYNFVQLKDDGDVIKVINTEFLKLWRYPNMGNDLNVLVTDFLDFAEIMGVYDQLKDAELLAA